MHLKGVNYDVGTLTGPGRLSRETLDPAVVAREIEIIHRDLHCNAIRISGNDIDRLTLAAQAALREGLEVWLSPSLVDADEAALQAYLAECAQAAENLEQGSERVVLMVGTELSLFMRGIVDDQPAMKRFAGLSKPWGMLKFIVTLRRTSQRLNGVLSRAAATIRQHYHGPLTYASGSWERVDWSLFDIVSIDDYRDKNNAKTYQKDLRGYFKHGKPVVVSEFGCCTYRGAEERGGTGWAIVDWDATPPKLKGTFVRDESVPSRYIADLLDIFKAEGVDGAFVFTFVSPRYVTSDDPAHDLDMASYSLVKSYADRCGQTYPEMPWEPKAAFGTVAAAYEAM